jgi:hypothetical protein
VEKGEKQRRVEDDHSVSEDGHHFAHDPAGRPQAADRGFL